MVPALMEFTKPEPKVYCYLGENTSVIGGLKRTFFPVSLKGAWRHSGLQSLCLLILSYTKSCSSPHTSNTSFFSTYMACIQIFITFPLYCSGLSESLPPCCVIPCVPSTAHHFPVSSSLCFLTVYVIMPALRWASQGCACTP